MSSPVLIVGAGPAGLVLALSLLKNGIKVQIIEKTEGLYIGQRGAGIMPRTLELFKALGVLPEIMDVGMTKLPIKTCVVGKGDSEVVAISNMHTFNEPTPAFPYFNPVGLGQGRVQRILASHLEKYGCYVETGTEIIGFEQHDDHVVYQLKKAAADGKSVEEEGQASYVVGADGGRGFVRKRLGLSFAGETREGEYWVTADVRIKNLNIQTEFWHMWGDFNQGYFTLRPTDRLDNDEFWLAIAGHNIDYDLLSTDKDAFIKVAREISGLQSLEIDEFMTLTKFKISVRMVDQFGIGRVFLAGDSAHSHPFTGAQGMNSSVQDSANLAWKLALVTKGLASPALLESYTAERLPVIADVLGLSTKLLKNAIDPEAVKNAKTAWARGLETLQLHVNYRESSIVFNELDSGAEGSVRVTAGDRAPDAPGLSTITKSPEVLRLFDLFGPARHIALIFPHSESEIAPFISALTEYPNGTVETVIVLEKTSAFTGEDVSNWGANVVVLDNKRHAWNTYPTSEGAKAIIVRPDGYIGLVAKSSKGVEKYREIIFGAIA